jgi:penicillin-binding protein 1A
MGGNLPLFSRAEALEEGREVTTSTGEIRRIAPQAGFGTISSGGLY